MASLAGVGLFRTSCLRATALRPPPSLPAFRHNLFARHSSPLHTLRIAPTPAPQPRTRLLSLALPAFQRRPFSLSSILRAKWRNNKTPAHTRSGGAPPPPPRFEGKPMSSLRARLDRASPMYIVVGFLAAYGVAFLAWLYASGKAKLDGDLKPLQFLVDNFTSSWPNYTAGRIWVAVTNAFMHTMPWHLAINGFVLYSFAPILIGLMGNVRFLGLYAFGAAASNMFSLALTPASERETTCTIGGSGAMFCLTTLWACVYPQSRFLLLFFIPVPAWGALGSVLAFDGYQAWLKAHGDRNAYSSKIDVAGHVGGILAGLAYYFVLVRFRVG